MKRICCGMLVGLSLAGAHQRDAAAQARLPSPEEYQKRDRRVAIHPQHPAKGIKTGLAIAYGHRIEPPYLVENKGGRVFINGIQVSPSLVHEREQAALPKSVPDEKRKQRSESLWKTTTEMQAMARKGIEHEKIITFAKGQPHVADVKWQHGMLMVTDDEGVPLGVMLPNAGDTLPSEAEKNRRADGAQKSALANIKQHLEANECVIFLADGGTSGHPITETFPAVIPVIMENSALSSEEKLRRLLEYLVEPAARDILANYTAEEWLKK